MSFHFVLFLSCIFILSIIDRAVAGTVFVLTNGEKITKFEATLLVPTAPTALQGKGPDWKIQATWAGLQPADSSCVLQNVVGNAGSERGHWSHIPSFYDGATKPTYTEDYFEKAQKEVYPGDKITSSWHLDEQTNEWFDSWSVVPGKIGTLNGEHAYEGNYTFDGSKYDPKVPDMAEALIMIEHLGLGDGVDPGWGSGPVTFTNILIESVSTKDWCNHENAQAWHPQDVKVVGVSTPFTSTVENGKKTCKISKLVIETK